MRLYILITTFLLAFQSTYCQINLEPVYFVLGTLSDYMGRFYYVDREKQIDRYYPDEKPLVISLTDYIKKELNIEVDTAFTKSNHCEMFSEELAKTLNSFYGKHDELINSKFETARQIYSFLAGVYYRNGEKLDSSIYKIQLSNSPKHQDCYVFLKKIGCENIFYQYLRNIPAIFILYFEPTQELKKYLDSIEFVLNKQLHYNQQEEGGDSQKWKDNEVEKIRNAFKR